MVKAPRAVDLYFILGKSPIFTSNNSIFNPLMQTGILDTGAIELSKHVNLALLIVFQE
jgi:hypothetical protein